MSFGSGGFGGFGQSNQQQQQQSTGFGGFGGASNTNNPSTGFGTQTTNAFGANNPSSTGTGLFGGGTPGFGSGGGGGGFGSTGGAFGSKPAFSATTTSGGPGLFGGSSLATAGGTGFGGFGATANNTTANQPSSGFGTGSSLFGGGTKTTSFGGTTLGSTSGGGGLFGGGGTGGFGGTTSTTGFGGATNNPGIGAAVGDPPGTGVLPFQPTIEKEANNPSQSNSFQNILFMENYKKWSGEELRLADYNQGRRYGSAGGAGAFGVNSGFGAASGFGATPQSNTGFGANAPGGGGMFGNNQQTTSTPFGGGGGATNTGFGAGTTTAGGGLFGAGANKPSTGGLFGAQPQPAAQTTGTFGAGATGFGAPSSTPSAGLFGTGNAAATTGGGGLFGAAASKPGGGFSFGNTANTGTGFGTTGTTTNTFGANTSTPSNAGGGLFGNTGQANTGGGMFGNAQQPATTGFGGAGFGAQNQNTSTSLFGGQQKPATTGLFGNAGANTTGGGGLFGNAAPNAAPSFGGTATNQPSGGLFGNKPATTGTGLFGTAATGQTNTTGGGLFGLGSNTQNQQPAQGGGLFGNVGANNQAKPSLFGNQPSTTGSLFGTQSTQQPGGFFGSNNPQQQQNQGFGGSSFGVPQNAQAAPLSLSTNIGDLSAYGSATLFSNLPDDKVQNPGPLATPLSGQAKMKSRSILPMYKLSPYNSSRVVTPQKRGYGFSYSTYGTPSTPSSVSSTPGGLNQSLLGASVNRGLSKSMSSSSLRRSFSVEDSILSPGAFSASTGPRLLGSNHKKLVINRDLRSSDLFASPTKDKHNHDGQDSQDLGSGSRKLAKRVSFDTPSPSTDDRSQQQKQQPDGEKKQGSASSTSSPTPNGAAEELGYLRPTAQSINGINGTKSTSSTSATPEMEQVKGKELAVVHEEEPTTPTVTIQPPEGSDKEAGAYWMDPPLEEINQMNRMQRQKVANFTVGRENVGSVTFRVPVDLSNIDLEHLFDNIVILETRSATVYPNQAKKPPVGKGLNVPATISLEQSWPRARDRRTTLQDKSGHRINKHIERLKRIENTTFENYDKDTGVWTFSVEHFTTYALEGDDDDDDVDGKSEVLPAVMSAAKSDVLKSVQNYAAVGKDVASPEIDPDDTFDFRRSRRAVPGAFDETAMSDEPESPDELAVARRAPSLSSEDEDEDDTQEIGQARRNEDEFMMTGNGGAEYEAMEQVSQQGGEFGEEQGESPFVQPGGGIDQQLPGGIMRARMRAVRKSTAPTKIEVAGGNDWTQILRESVKAPRTVDRAALREMNESGAAWDIKERGSPVPRDRKVSSDGAGFATSIDLMKSLFEAQSTQVASPAAGFVKWPYQRRPKVGQDGEAPVPRPNWGPDGKLLVTDNTGISLQQVDTGMTVGSDTIRELDAYVSRITGSSNSSSSNSSSSNSNTGDAHTTSSDWTYGDDAKWKLAAILMGGNAKVALLEFWEQLLSDATSQAMIRAASGEEKAILSLASNRMDDACAHLLAAGNFRLANLVASIGTQTKDIRAQLKDWREANVLAEFSEPIRALYELLGGNACVCAGTKGVPIENRLTSFVISQRFGLDWMQSFGLRLFCTGTSVDDAVRSFQADIEQGKEPSPEDDALWALLKAYAYRKFDWAAVDSIGWLLTQVLMTHRNIGGEGEDGIDFGTDVDVHWNRTCVAFAETLTSRGHWVLGAIVLGSMHQARSRDPVLLDHLGRHAHLLGSPEDSASPFSVLRTAGRHGNFLPETHLWEAKALYFRSRRDAKQEFLALLWAHNYSEANAAFVRRLAPELVVRRDYARLHRFASLLHRVRHRLPDWSRGALAYLLFPMARLQTRLEPRDALDDALLDALVHLRGGAAKGDARQEAAIADMAEELLRCRGDDARLYQLLPEDVKGRYFRDAALSVA